jgi:dual specificity MAP kinase phosphatase
MNYSKITHNLYIGTTPRTNDYEVLHQFGISLVINMRIGLPPARDPISPSLKSLWLPTIDSPIIPIPMRALHRGVEAALRVMEAGGVLYTHCSKGRHRGPAMGACILIAQGMLPEQAIQLIEQQRPVADLHAWHILRRIMKFTQTWKDQK